MTDKKRIILQQHNWQADDLDTIRRLLDKGSFDKAEPLLTHYLNDNPDDFRAQFLVGRLYISTDRYAEARIIYEYLRAKYPDRTDIALNLAKSYDLLMDWDRSGALYREILEREPQNLKATLGHH